MKCPFCQHPNTQVTDSRLLEETTSQLEAHEMRWLELQEILE